MDYVIIIAVFQKKIRRLESDDKENVVFVIISSQLVPPSLSKVLFPFLNGGGEC